VIFDGKKFAGEIIAKLPKRKAKLAIFLDPKNIAGVKYVELKSKVARRLGVEIEILNSKLQDPNKSKILNLNKDPNITGIMIQLPFPNSSELIELIDSKKDVDGLREDSPFMPAVVRAVREILNSNIEIPNKFKTPNPKIIILGSKGFVGKKLIKILGIQYSVFGMDKDDFDPERSRRADIIISVTGQKEIIDDSMVKPGFVAIDVGYPEAEFTQSALKKASFYTPVPGGVGPVTVAMLFANLLVNV